jgi:general secretion pathway protein I
MEVLISVAVLSVALIAVLKSSLQIQDTLIKGREMTTSALLTANIISKVKAVGPDAWNDHYGRFKEYPKYSWEVDISNVAENSLRTIVVTILDKKSKEEIKSIEEHIFVYPKP